MADAERLICPAGAVAERGRGVRFDVDYFGEPAPAFVIRKDGNVHGYLNRCAHVAMELDWQEGVFFDSAGRDLLCSTHGALYDASSGRCLGGPCNRKPLIKLRVAERNGYVYFMGFEDD
jgi:nitrite reductase/ring-hydroxylating ferredoxin subunit